MDSEEEGCAQRSAESECLEPHITAIRTESKPVVPWLHLHTHTHTHAIRRRGVKLSVRVFQRTGRSSREDLDVASSSDRVRRHRRCSVSREIESQPIIGRAKKPTSLSFEFLSDSSLPSCNNARKEAADRACALEMFLVPFVDGSKRTRRVCCG